ncbi:MAG: hypothetical protein O3A80_02535 [bacterium]|nr:hypothetical protein [bacterium]
MPSGVNPELQAQQTERKEGNTNLVVTQPEKFEGLLETISLMDKISERMSEDKSGDLGGGGSSTGKGDDDDSVSARAQAIANLPDTPQMRKELGVYIQKEIKVLRKEVRRKAFRASKPGSAYKLNDLYSKIRRLNSLLAELMETSVDVLKRIFIRVLIDKQSI